MISTRKGQPMEIISRSSTTASEREKKLHLVHEVQFGDRLFDDAFLVEGNPDVAQSLLNDEVREQMYFLSHRAPRLSLKEGVTELNWSGPWSRTTREPDVASGLAAATRALGGMCREIDRARASVEE
jgi:hypothetical protein